MNVWLSLVLVAGIVAATVITLRWLDYRHERRTQNAEQAHEMTMEAMDEYREDATPTVTGDDVARSPTPVDGDLALVGDTVEVRLPRQTEEARRYVSANAVAGAVIDQIAARTNTNPHRVVDSLAGSTIRYDAAALGELEMDEGEYLLTRDDFGLGR